MSPSVTSSALLLLIALIVHQTHALAFFSIQIYYYSGQVEEAVFINAGSGVNGFPSFSGMKAPSVDRSNAYIWAIDAGQIKFGGYQSVWAGTTGWVSATSGAWSNYQFLNTGNKRSEHEALEVEFDGENSTFPVPAVVPDSSDDAQNENSTISVGDPRIVRSIQDISSRNFDFTRFYMQGQIFDISLVYEQPGSNFMTWDFIKTSASFLGGRFDAGDWGNGVTKQIGSQTVLINFSVTSNTHHNWLSGNIIRAAIRRAGNFVLKPSGYINYLVFDLKFSDGSKFATIAMDST